MKNLITVFAFLFVLKSQAQTFILNDTILANNVFQVEFSADSRSMVWCQNLGGGLAKVWYADLDLATFHKDFTF
jgi:hypothetical protein